MSETRAAASAGDVRVAAEPEPPAEWDEYVEDAPGATFSHLAGWRQVMEGVLGHECLYASARDPEGTLRGVLPLVSVRSRLFGRFLVSMPFLNYGGPLGTPAARRGLGAWAAQRARDTRADLLELRARTHVRGGGEASGDAAVAEELTVRARKVTVLLDLPSEPETLWEDGLRAKVRSQVRRPMKEGLEVRFGPDQVEPFYEVFARNMRDLGTPVLPARMFQALPEVFGERVLFAAVYLGEQPVASGCGFLFGGEFEITWASALREHSRIAPNMLLYWKTMERAIGMGASVFNFGRCTPGSGTHRFKLQWGGRDEELPWATWSPGGRSATPQPEGGVYGLAVEAWKRLPLRVTRILGPPLARRIP